MKATLLLAAAIFIHSHGSASAETIRQSGGSSGISAATADADYLQVDGGNIQVGNLEVSASSFSVGGTTFAIRGGRAIFGREAAPVTAMETYPQAKAFIFTATDNKPTLIWPQFGQADNTFGLGVDQTGGNYGLGFYTGVTSRMKVTTSAQLILGTAYAASAGGVGDIPNSLVVQSSVSVGNVLPATKLDVRGNAQFGDGATRSTFTVTADLVMGGYFLPLLRTKAQIDALAGTLGAQVVCSDCTVPYDICIGTGTGVSQWRATINSAINTAVPGTLVPKGCGSGN